VKFNLTQQLFTIRGAIRYYAGAYSPVQGETVQLQGPSAISHLTDVDGAYQTSPLLAAEKWTLMPKPRIGSSFDMDAVSSLDAAYILQAAVGLRTLGRSERLAADVTGNGTVSALDASLIMQYRVGIISRFPAAAACGSDWLFDPVDTIPSSQCIKPTLSIGTCQMGAITYDPLMSDAANQDFQAILLGDVTGNWTPPPGG
jgi:hypothetical protein